MSGIISTKETFRAAVDTFKLDAPGRPELVPLGLPAIDDELGGLGPGSLGVLAAATGVGKSSTMLSAMLRSPVKVGAVSAEDGPDVVGTRLLAALSGIDSLRIRRKDLSEGELSALRKIASEGREDMYFAYPMGGRIQLVETAIEEMGAEGCRLVWIDYLQCLSVPGKQDRRMEINEVMSRIHEAADRANVAVMLLSQFRRLVDGEKIPQIYHLKESGDIENKARIIILAHKQESPGEEPRIRYRLAKSTYGGEYIKFDMVRDQSGTLRPASYYRPGEDF